eukprot:GEMP01079371.1.p2 GENE.GEMP01079371.1~~GEMP01079371.1.p2  ORF type:complete len:146 (+),score=20.54 GEMP01079371.1:57-494(+)
MSFTYMGCSVLHLSFLAVQILILVLEVTGLSFAKDEHYWGEFQPSDYVLLLQRCAISCFIETALKHHERGKQGAGIHVVCYSSLAVLYRASSFWSLKASPKTSVGKLLDACLFLNVFFFIASFAFVVPRKETPKNRRTIPAIFSA